MSLPYTFVILISYFLKIYLFIYLFQSLFQDWHSYVDDLKAFSDRHGYDGLVVLLSISGPCHHPYQQVAVYSNNTDILNQVSKMEDNNYSYQEHVQRKTKTKKTPQLLHW